MSHLMTGIAACSRDGDPRKITISNKTIATEEGRVAVVDPLAIRGAVALSAIMQGNRLRDV